MPANTDKAINVPKNSFNQIAFLIRADKKVFGPNATEA